MTFRIGLLLLCCSLVGCATARVVRLDTGEGTPIVYTPARRTPAVEMDQGEFERAMMTLILEMKFSLRDEEGPRVRLASATEAPGGRYHRWCSQQSSPDECLSLLEGDLSLAGASARRQLALSFAWDGVWEGVASEIQNELQDMVNPVTLRAMITMACVAYMGLLLLPEPTTKVVVASVTLLLIAYIGLEAFLDILDGWRELSESSERAQSFEELEDAGHRFGDVMGKNGARVIILALTTAIGGGAAKLASKAPTLPGFGLAALKLKTSTGLELRVALAGGARSVAVSKHGILVGLAPGVVAAVATDSSGQPSGGSRFGSGVTKSEGEWVPSNESMSERAAAYQGRITGHPEEVFYRNGVKFDGIKDGVLLDAKGPGYAKFVRNGKFRKWFTGADGMVEQAQDQIAAADGMPIQWHFAEEVAANATRALFEDWGIRGIQIVVTP